MKRVTRAVNGDRGGLSIALSRNPPRSSRSVRFVGCLAVALLVTSCGGGAGDGTVLMSPAGTASVMPTQSLPTAGTAAELTCPALANATPVPGGLPALRLPCLGPGPAVDLAALRGTPTVLNVWAAWCVNCSREMPLFDAAAKTAGKRVRFLGIHAFAGAAEGRDAAARFPVRFPSLQDSGPRGLRSTLGVAGPPYTFFVRADGKLAYTKVGEIRSAAELARLIDTHLGVTL